MDYGAYGPYVCTLNAAKTACDMGQSAISAAESLKAFYGIPYNRIEVGGN